MRALSWQLQTRRLMSQLEGQTIHNQRSQTLEFTTSKSILGYIFNNIIIVKQFIIDIIYTYWYSIVFGSGKRTTWFKLIRSKMVPIDIKTIEFLSD
jgi:hypothetical protein